MAGNEWEEVEEGNELFDADTAESDGPEGAWEDEPADVDDLRGETGQAE
jgi:hypothetical protein